MEKHKKQRIIEYISLAIAALVLLIGVFILNRTVPFMEDDLWYATNLVTGDKLASFKDVIESQVWHFNNWGGRNITHGILQLVIMGGELFADIMNVVFLCLLVWVMGAFSKKRKPFLYFVIVSLLIALNPAARVSMFWEAGCVNYVYSTAWILLFIFLYAGELKLPEGGNFARFIEGDGLTASSNVKIKGIEFLIIPLGLMTGWSNENMGPASFCIAVLSIVWMKFVMKKKVPLWSILGAVLSFIGSILVIIAPGNLVRSATITKTVSEKIFDRLYGYFESMAEFLFPVIILTCALLLIYIIGLNRRLNLKQYVLLITAVLAQGAMILSPTYPARATFGVLACLIALSASILSEVKETYGTTDKKIRVLLYVTAVIFWLWAVIYVCGQIVYPPEV